MSNRQLRRYRQDIKSHPYFRKDFKNVTGYESGRAVTPTWPWEQTKGALRGKGRWASEESPAMERWKAGLKESALEAYREKILEERYEKLVKGFCNKREE